MPLISDDLRIAKLQEVGCSTALIKLAGGECVHGLFRNTCLGPPFIPPNSRSPKGAPITPLWEETGRIYGLRCLPGAADFIRFSIEHPDGMEFIAATEQGLWAHRFDFFYESDASLLDLREAAQSVEFRFLDLYLDVKESAGDEMGTYVQHRTWLSQFIADIDQRSMPLTIIS
ncbi:MAG TPA: hypothetical protein VGM83_12895 [Devosiaceae bacterium]|jgi:hypothetical protein